MRRHSGAEGSVARSGEDPGPRAAAWEYSIFETTVARQ